MAGLLDALQGASNSVASNVSAPVDGLAWLLRKAGIPVGDAPIGGSDWMAQKGFTREPENRSMGLLGEALGGVAPMLMAAKALHQSILRTLQPHILESQQSHQVVIYFLVEKMAG